VFDLAVQPRLVAEFLGDPCHHLVVSLDEGIVVGMASAVHYVHPDKAPQLFINEVGVAPTHRRRGLGTAMVNALLAIARELQCTEAWVLTDRSNPSAMRLYEICGGIPNRQDQVMFEFRLNE
jgi:ribosomal protein S18 acetylase RimI-like enzyme